MEKNLAIKILNNTGDKNIVEISMDPSEYIHSHVHEWNVDIVILKGSLQIFSSSGNILLLPGDRYKLKKNIEHSELSGKNGVTFLSARPKVKC